MKVHGQSLAVFHAAGLGKMSSPLRRLMVSGSIEQFIHLIRVSVHVPESCESVVFFVIYIYIFKMV